MIVQAAKIERDRHGGREPEDREQHEEGDRKGDLELPVPEVVVEDGVEVVLDRRRAGDVDLRHPRGVTDGTEHRVGVALCMRERQGRVDVAVDHRRASGHAGEVEPLRGSARDHGGGAPDGGGEVRAQPSGLRRARLPRSSNTIVNAPSERSPNFASSTFRTCSESVPGTEKVFERIAESFVLAKPPARKTTIHAPRITRRCRMTKRVHPATTTRYLRAGPRERLMRPPDTVTTMTPRDKPATGGVQSEIEELFADLWQVPRFAGLRRGFRPNVDSYHTDDPHELTVVVEAPGIDPASLTIVVERADAR